MPAPLAALHRRFAALPYALRMACATLAFSCGVGLFIHALSRQSLFGSIVYSMCIGLFCWSLIDGSRLASAALLRRLFPRREAARHGWPGWPVMSVCLAVAVPLAYGLGSALADRLLGLRSQSLWDSHWREVAGVLLVSLAASVLATGFFYARGRLNAARGEAEQARRLAAETQLRLLQSQLEPHMLYNTLATLRVLIGLDPPRAQAMLDRLIAFLRATLNASRSDAHALGEEFARLEDYLALMQLRMGARLRTRLVLPAELAALPVPPLLLQPLVENAIKHGLEPHVDGGELEVTAARDAAQGLLLTVRDSGVGLGFAAAQGGTGFGLQQVRERLRTRYGTAAGLSLGPAAAGGTEVRLWLPLEDQQGA